MQGSAVWNGQWREMDTRLEAMWMSMELETTIFAGI